MEHQTTKITNIIQKQKSKVGIAEPGFETQCKISVKVGVDVKRASEGGDLETDPH